MKLKHLRSPQNLPVGLRERPTSYRNRSTLLWGIWYVFKTLAVSWLPVFRLCHRSTLCRAPRLPEHSKNRRLCRVRDADQRSGASCPFAGPRGSGRDCYGFLKLKDSQEFDLLVERGASDANPRLSVSARNCGMRVDQPGSWGGTTSA